MTHGYILDAALAWNRLKSLCLRVNDGETVKFGISLGGLVPLAKCCSDLPTCTYHSMLGLFTRILCMVFAVGMSGPLLLGRIQVSFLRIKLPVTLFPGLVVERGTPNMIA